MTPHDAWDWHAAALSARWNAEIDRRAAAMASVVDFLQAELPGSGPELLQARAAIESARSHVRRALDKPQFRPAVAWVGLREIVSIANDGRG